PVLLAEYTTLGLGGPAGSFRRAVTTDEPVSAVVEADRAEEPVLILGGGSNLVVADTGFPGVVVHADSQGVSFEEAGIDPRTGEEVVVLRAEGGGEWGSLVERTVAEGLNGLEFLSGIPGRCGGTA